MRISDWSSDVCSSDLVLGSTFGIGERPGENEREQQIGGIHGRASLTMHSCDENPYAFSCASALLRTTSLAVFDATVLFGCLRLQRPPDPIVRASRRARVCQSVYIWRGPVS